MKLVDLDAQFLKYAPDGDHVYLRNVQSLREADGVIFLCPLCFQANNGRVGTHSVICWFTGKVPDDVGPKPGRWNPQGDGLHDLTFIPPGAVSVQLLGEGCQWHGFVANGEAV